MSMQQLNTLVLRHYFRTKPLKCTLVSGSTDSFFSVQPTEALNIGSSIVKGDPVLFGKFDENHEVEISGGHVIALTGMDNNFIILPDKIGFNYERREYERYPVSLFGYMAYGNNMENTSQIYIKDISYSGFRIYTSAVLSVEDVVKIDVYCNHNVLNVEAQVVRKSLNYGRNEYGIQIIFKTKSSIYKTKDYLDGLINDEKDLILKQLYRQ